MGSSIKQARKAILLVLLTKTCYCSRHYSKGGFFSERCFSHCQNKYFRSLSWAWNLNKLFTVMGGKFKFQVQYSDLEYYFWRFNKLKRCYLYQDNGHEICSVLLVWLTNFLKWNYFNFSRMEKTIVGRK